MNGCLDFHLESSLSLALQSPRLHLHGFLQSFVNEDIALQDHFRKVVKPSYTNVVRDRGGAVGIVEFETAEDLDRAIRKLDDTEFRNPFDRGYIRIQEDDGARGGRGRSRSRSRSR